MSPTSSAIQARGDILVSCNAGLGDAVLLSGAIRDIVRANPNRFRFAVDTHWRGCFDHNPFVVPREHLVNPIAIDAGWTPAGSDRKSGHLLDAWTDEPGEKTRRRGAAHDRILRGHLFARPGTKWVAGIDGRGPLLGAQ